MGISQKLIGITAIFVIPVMYIGAIALTILSGAYSLGPVLSLLSLVAVIGVYFFWLLGSIQYGPDDISEVRIPGADRKTVDLLKMTNRRGNLINVRLLDIFKDEESHSRSTVKKALEGERIRLSQPTVDKYVKRLEGRGLISSPSTAPYDRPYRITDEGKNYLWLAQTYLPKRRVFFLWRHYLGIRRRVKKTQAEAKGISGENQT